MADQFFYLQIESQFKLAQLPLSSHYHPLNSTQSSRRSFLSNLLRSIATLLSNKRQFEKKSSKNRSHFSSFAVAHLQYMWSAIFSSTSPTIINHHQCNDASHSHSIYRLSATLLCIYKHQIYIWKEPFRPFICTI